MLGPSTTRATAIAARYSSRPASGADRIAVSGLARKFCTITSWIAPYCRAVRRIANSDSARSAMVSPMPTRMPVVNGIVLRPASSSTRSRTAGSLSGEPKCAPPGSVKIAVDVVSSIIPMDGATGLSRCISSQLITPGVEVRQQPGLLQHPDRHRPQVGQRAVVAVAVQPFPGLRPAVLRPVAEGEQRLLAAERRALPGDLQDLVGREVGGRQPARHGDEGAVVPWAKPDT